MKPAKLTTLLALALMSAGCAHHVGFHSSHVGFDTQPRYAQPSAIPCYGSHPLRYTIYYGSDAKWHYFETHRDVRIQRYKVPRWSLPNWRPEFPVGKYRVHVERNAKGKLQASNG
jgi:hypothetical protein